MEQVDFSLKELMENFTASMEYSAKEKGLDFTCTMEPDLPEYFTGDPGRIRQVLTNLTGIALKFTERGKISVTCRLEKKLPDSHLVYFSVKDTGIGIPKDTHVKLFQKFTQADGSTTEKYGETGLELAISKQLAELMSGETGVESEAGKGSTFWCMVKLKKAKRNPETTSVADQDKSSLTQSYTLIKNNKDRIKLLLVEDNYTNRIVAYSVLEKLGFNADIAENGEEAVKALKNTSYDLVFMDMQMPVMSSNEAARIIWDRNSNVLNHDIPIIAMTANVMKGDRDIYLEGRREE